MQVICVSRGTFSGGSELAELLAKKLGCSCVSREDLIEAATREGIQVGKLEMAMVKPGSFSGRLALEREHYLAVTTAFLCDRAKEGRLVYHGRTGHLLLPGVSHVLRVRVVADEDFRVKSVMQRLKLDRDRAIKYLHDVDEDRMHWVHSMYGVSWEDAGQYDVIINLQQMSVENAASLLVGFAQLPDFQMTPASDRAMDNLSLAAHARVLLARDGRTKGAGFKVRADGGVVTVTYLPRFARIAEAIPNVLEALSGLKEVRATMATTNILWVQEKFDHASDSFRQIVEIATKWNSAVELVRLTANGSENGHAEVQASPAPAPAQPGAPREYNGGVEDDVAEEKPLDDGGLAKTMDELALIGRAGGGRMVGGGQEKLVASLDRSTPYSLVVIGDVFLEKSQAARVRLSRELQSYLGDHVKAPVVGADELKTRFLFGKRDALKMAGLLAAVIVIYLIVFTNQKPVIELLTGSTWQMKALASAAVFMFVPMVAYLYGTITKSFLKLIKME